MAGDVEALTCNPSTLARGLRVWAEPGLSWGLKIRRMERDGMKLSEKALASTLSTTKEKKKKNCKRDVASHSTALLGSNCKRTLASALPAFLALMLTCCDGSQLPLPLSGLPCEACPASDQGWLQLRPLVWHPLRNGSLSVTVFVSLWTDPPPVSRPGDCLSGGTLTAAFFRPDLEDSVGLHPDSWRIETEIVWSGPRATRFWGS